MVLTVHLPLTAGDDGDRHLPGHKWGQMPVVEIIWSISIFVSLSVWIEAGSMVAPFSLNSSKIPSQPPLLDSRGGGLWQSNRTNWQAGAAQAVKVESTV